MEIQYPERIDDVNTELGNLIQDGFLEVIVDQLRNVRKTVIPFRKFKISTGIGVLFFDHLLIEPFSRSRISTQDKESWVFFFEGNSVIMTAIFAKLHQK